MVTSLTKHQREVLRAFDEFGHSMDDVTLTGLVHHLSPVMMSSSSIRSRRAELARATADRGPLLEVVGTKKLKSGRRAAIFALTVEGRTLVYNLFIKPIASLV